MKRIIYILAAVIALPLIPALTSCERNNGTNPTDSSSVYYQSYYVMYDKNTKTTEATAMFRITDSSGTIHTLVGNESLNINRNIADYRADRKYHWSSNKLENVEFVFTKNAGAQFLNVLRTTDTSDAQFPTVFPSAINKNSGMAVDWDGKPVDTLTERLVLIIDDNVHTPVYRYYSMGKFVFTSGDLINLNPGDVKISLEREKTYSLQTSDPGSTGGMRRVAVRTSRTITLL
jgi:hypothetical protein